MGEDTPDTDAKTDSSAHTEKKSKRKSKKTANKDLEVNDRIDKSSNDQAAEEQISEGPGQDWIDDLQICLMFLTRIPVPDGLALSHPSLSNACRFFPVIGSLVGAIGAIVLAAADQLGLPQGVSALLAVAAMVMVTGGLHEDGLSDTDELENGTDPNNADSDEDLLTDSEELEYGTDPNNPDSDGDGLSDGQEVENGTDPLAVDGGDEEKEDAASCSTTSNPAGLWPMVLMVFPFLRRKRK